MTECSTAERTREMQRHFLERTREVSTKTEEKSSMNLPHY